jgi:hypothetical protein
VGRTYQNVSEKFYSNVQGKVKTASLKNTKQSQSHVTTDGQSVSMSRCQAPSGSHDQTFVTV